MTLLPSRQLTNDAKGQRGDVVYYCCGGGGGGFLFPIAEYLWESMAQGNKMSSGRRKEKNHDLFHKNIF